MLPFQAVFLFFLFCLCLSLFCSPLVKVALVPIATHSELLLISVYAALLNGLNPAPHSCDFIPTHPSPQRDFTGAQRVAASVDVWTFA